MSTNKTDKIEKALDSLSGIERACTDPYFFTRLEARMIPKKTIWEDVSYFLSKPMIAIAGICCVIMINAFVIFSGSSKNTDVQKTEIAGIMDEYNQLGNNNLFEFENIKP